MQITINSARGKNKATELKKQMQQVCLTNRSTKPEQIPNYRQNKKDSQSKDNQLQKRQMKLKQNSSKPNFYSNQFKQHNLKKGLINSTLSTTNLKNNKQNFNCNQGLKYTAIKLTSSVVLKNQKVLSEKNIKKLNLGKSLELTNNTLNKAISNTTINREKKIMKFNNENLQKSKQKKKIKNILEISTLIQRSERKFCLKDFDIGKKLGKGRFGNVYLAQHKQNQFSLAIKMINIKQLKESQMQSQLIEQIKLQMYMNHPNILKMYGFFSDEKNIYLLLQLGNSCLFKQLRHKKHFSQQQTAYYIKQIIQSLKYLHNENIIHRDIKPQNILMSQGVLKLSDFGWSIYSPIHKRQTFCGTLDYVPPQIVQGDFYDERVDIWSLGVLCYQLAIGNAPFEVPNDQEGTYDKILSVELNFPSHLSPELKDLISKILIRQPKKRLNLSQIENHIWLSKYNTVGRYISKQIWQSWDNMK